MCLGRDWGGGGGGWGGTLLKQRRESVRLAKVCNSYPFILTKTWIFLPITPKLLNPAPIFKTKKRKIKF